MGWLPRRRHPRFIEQDSGRLFAPSAAHWRCHRSGCEWNRWSGCRRRHWRRRGSRRRHRRRWRGTCRCRRVSRGRRHWGGRLRAPPGRQSFSGGGDVPLGWGGRRHRCGRRRGRLRGRRYRGRSRGRGWSGRGRRRRLRGLGRRLFTLGLPPGRQGRRSVRALPVGRWRGVLRSGARILLLVGLAHVIHLQQARRRLQPAAGMSTSGRADGASGPRHRL